MKHGGDAAHVGIAERVGELNDEHGDEHRAGEEECIETRQKPGDEQDRSEELGVRRDIAEENGDVVAREIGGESGGAALAEDLRVAVRDEDRAGRDAKQQRRDVGSQLIHVTLFGSVYLATFLFFGMLTRLAYLSALVAAATATAFTNLIVDKGRWRIGLFVPPLLAVREFLLGASLAVCCIGVTDWLIFSTTSLHHVAGTGFPWRELFIVYLPASVHEELVFRGYLFQKIRAWNRRFAIASSAIVFGTLHTINGGITPIAIVNLIIAGVLLALAYELFERLWLPIGIHVTWNLLTGPILGYSVSGFSSEKTLLVTLGSGPDWLTGGSFGIEGSVWTGLVELAGVAALLWARKRRTV
jgi:membrane protease YdiL (CAAX protease family)